MNDALRRSSEHDDALALVCHPDTPSAAIASVHARVRRLGGVLELEFAIAGDVDRIRIPPARPRALVHGLWEHTCCEVFVARDAGAAPDSAYGEINLAPSGEWAAYAFSAYRAPVGVLDALAPEIAVEVAPGRLVLGATIALERLSGASLAAPLRLALSAVVEEEGDALSYWSLRHPAGKPDFHHPDAFALRLPAREER